MGWAGDKYMPINNWQLALYLQFWKKYLSQIFWRHSWDVGTLIPNNFEIVVCLSVCYLAYFLTEIRQISNKNHFTVHEIHIGLHPWLVSGLLSSGFVHSVLCTVNSLMYVQHVVCSFDYQNYPSPK